jgi:hypothetical protein
VDVNRSIGSLATYASYNRACSYSHIDGIGSGDGVIVGAIFSFQIVSRLKLELNFSVSSDFQIHHVAVYTH